MSEMNPLEAQLKSWAPRRPSARLERKLFGAPASKAPLIQSFGWLAPAMACLLFVGVIANQRSETTFSIGAVDEEMVAMSLSNQSYAAYLPGSFKQKQNRWDTFEWTNGGGFTSSVHPFPQAETDGSDRK